MARLLQVFVTVLTFAISVIAFQIVLYKRKERRYSAFAGPLPSWPTGNVGLLTKPAASSPDSRPRNINDLYVDLAERFGPVFRFWLGTMPTIVVAGACPGT
jgi:hypothetical protein